MIDTELIVAARLPVPPDTPITEWPQRDEGLNLRSLRRLVQAVQAMRRVDNYSRFYNDETWLAAYEQAGVLAEEFKDL